ncbi:Mycobacterium numidiamassiliense ORFan [Mycobacterium numidiamassiliense]|uniref:Mycobacterium numidiamassiliense ORFan n=1 Tax=Mycobacterium numidiamassiliense TaxID=1841861 RepID=A0A2U3PBN2_9MYCO|nr:Mycobacterium numidiamassiliense ORFan [Mycobacterium numidiamassiliense]
MALNLLTQHYATLRESSVGNAFRNKAREFVVDTPISRHWQAARR